MGDNYYAGDGRDCNRAWEIDTNAGSVAVMTYAKYRDDFCSYSNPDEENTEPVIDPSSWFDDFTAWIGGPIGDMLKGISDFLNKIIYKVSTWIGEIIDYARNTFTKITDAIRNMLATLGETLSNLWETVKNVVRDIWHWIEALYERVRDWIVNAVKDIAAWIVDVYERVKDAFLTLIDNVWNWLKSLAVTLWEGLKDVVSTVWDWLKQFGKWLFEGLKTVLDGIAGFFDGIGKWIVQAVADLNQAALESEKQRDADMRALFSEVEEAQMSFFDNVAKAAMWLMEQIEYVSGLSDEELIEHIMKALAFVVKKQLAFSRELAREVLEE